MPCSRSAGGDRLRRPLRPRCPARHFIPQESEGLDKLQIIGTNIG
jgi:hypothetical protein